MIDGLVARFFSVFDNRNGTRPRLADLIDCFAEKALVVRRSDAGTELFTASEFAVPRIELLSQGSLLDFHEWETSSSTQIFGGIATRTSRYGKAGLLNGNAYCGSGTKCFHLVSLDSDWRITSLVWVDDNSQPAFSRSDGFFGPGAEFSAGLNAGDGRTCDRIALMKQMTAMGHGQRNKAIPIDP